MFAKVLSSYSKDSILDFLLYLF